MVGLKRFQFINKGSVQKSVLGLGNLVSTLNFSQITRLLCHTSGRMETRAGRFLWSRDRWSAPSNPVLYTLTKSSSNWPLKRRILFSQFLMHKPYKLWDRQTPLNDTQIKSVFWKTFSQAKKNCGQLILLFYKKHIAHHFGIGQKTLICCNIHSKFWDFFWPL